VFIKDKLKEKAVLLYATEKFVKYLRENEVSFLSLDSNDLVDEPLRHLDNISGDSYTFVVTTKEFNMRGLDFRAQLRGIALIIAASFTNRRALL
jgi:hypothetical protein